MAKIKRAAITMFYDTDSFLLKDFFQIFTDFSDFYRFLGTQHPIENPLKIRKNQYICKKNPA